MKEVKLKVIETLHQRLAEEDPLLQVILGPRQVGKTTAIRLFIEKFGKKKPTHYVSAEGIDSPLWIQAQWQEAKSNSKILIIDEVQKIPNWSEMIKKLWDSEKQKRQIFKCVLLGSSSLSLNKGLTESLTGRFETIRLYHWNFQTSLLIKKFSIDEFLIYGGYPGSYRFIKDKRRWSEYLAGSIVETVIGKDILMQTQVRSPALFRQAFYILVSYPAQIVSYNKILGQLQDKGNIDLIKYYLELFESAYLIKSIFKFSRSEISKKSSSPKIIPLAPSLSTFFRLDNLTPEDCGRVFEALVGAEFIKAGLEVYYWAEGHYEVDYIVIYKKQIIAIEIKSGRNKTSVSLEKFKFKYPSAKVVFVTKENFNKFSENPENLLEQCF